MKNVDKKPVGTGPFMFAEWSPGDHIKVVKNPKYYRPGQPILDAIVFKTVPDAQVRLTNLQTNAVQMVDGIDAKDVEDCQGYSSARVIQSKPILNYEMLQINTKRAPFSTSGCGRRSRGRSTARATSSRSGRASRVRA